MSLIHWMMYLVPFVSLVIAAGVLGLRLDEKITLAWWKVIAVVVAILGTGAASFWIAGTMVAHV